jgi:hypothetical protein
MIPSSWFLSRHALTAIFLKAARGRGLRYTNGFWDDIETDTDF